MELNIGFYGLIHSLPIVYFSGLLFLGISFILTLVYYPTGYQNRILLALQTIGLLTALWLIPIAVGSHPGISMAYRNIRLIDGIAAQGIDVQHNPYLAWPLFHILFSILVRLGINIEGLVRIFPFITQLLCLIPLYVFLNNLLGKQKEKYCWFGIWLFYLGNWVGVDGFCPQSLAILLLLIILALATHNSTNNGAARTKIIMYTLIVFSIFALILTHMLTAIATICILTVYMLVHKNYKLLLIPIICGFTVLGWDISFGAHYTFGLAGGDYSKRLLQIDSVSPSVNANPTTEINRRTGEEVQIDVDTYKLMDRTGGYLPKSNSIITLDPEYIINTNITSSLSGSESHIAVVKIRIINSAVFALLGLIGSVFILIYRRSRTVLAILAMSLSLFLLIPLRYAGWELITRLYLFELPFVAYFGALLLGAAVGFRKYYTSIILCVLFMVASTLFLISHYGNQVSDYWSEDYRAGYQFLQEHKAISYDVYGELRYINYVDEKVTLSWHGFPKTNYYFALSKQDDCVFTHIYNRPNFVDSIWKWAEESPNLLSIYKNPEYEVFEWIPEKVQ